MRRSGLLLMTWLCVSLRGGQPGPPVGEILSRVRANLAEFEAAIPDFVANETVWSRRVVKGKVTKQTVAESVLTCIRKPRPNDDGGKFVESREVTAVDGKAARKGRQWKGPTLFRGGFSTVLGVTFSAANLRYQNFAVAGTESIGGKPALIVAFATRDGQRVMGLLYRKFAVSSEIRF